MEMAGPQLTGTTLPGAGTPQVSATEGGDASLDDRVSNGPGGGVEAGELAIPFNELAARPAYLSFGSPEVIIGDSDDRIQITDTTLFPWRAICSLRIRAGDGTSWIGTGWLVSNRVVMTAGHCVYMRDHGKWARSIEVIPGRNGGAFPFGSIMSTSFGSSRGWAEKTLSEYDYGAILLPPNAIGARVGHFGFANESDADLGGTQLNLSGYPGDKNPAGTQWWHAQPTASAESRTIRYGIDTMAGQSGAPVWRSKNGSRYVVGIHTNGLSTNNWATRIQKNVFDNISAWVADNK